MPTYQPTNQPQPASNQPTKPTEMPTYQPTNQPQPASNQPTTPTDMWTCLLNQSTTTSYQPTHHTHWYVNLPT